MNERPSVVNTIEQMVPIVPDGDPLKAELQHLSRSIFIELPEDGLRHWKNLEGVLCRRLQADNLEPWAEQLLEIWNQCAVKLGGEPQGCDAASQASVRVDEDACPACSDPPTPTRVEFSDHLVEQTLVCPTCGAIECGPGTPLRNGASTVWVCPGCSAAWEIKTSFKHLGTRSMRG